MKTIRTNYCIYTRLRSAGSVSLSPFNLRYNGYKESDQEVFITKLPKFGGAPNLNDCQCLGIIIITSQINQGTHRINQ